MALGLLSKGRETTFQTMKTAWTGVNLDHSVDKVGGQASVSQEGLPSVSQTSNPESSASCNFRRA
eukprot:8115024-Prorocentrum_lima.AAC.1